MFSADAKRIVFFTPTSNGGHALYTRELLTALVGSGAPYRFELVTSGDLQEEFLTDRYPIARILPPLRHRSAFPTALHWAASRATHYLVRERAFLSWLALQRDVGLVHLQEWSSWLAPWFIGAIRRLGIRVACSVHNLSPHVPLPFPLDRLERRANVRALRQVDLSVVHTDGLKRSLTARLGADRQERIHVVPHGVWTGARPALRLGKPRARLLCFGTVRRNKGFDVAVDVLSELPEAELTLAGPPEDARYAAELRAQIAASPNRARVHARFEFIPTADVPALFQDADLLLLPYTEFAAQSGVLHLALAHGVPVVVSDVGGLGELVRELGIGRVMQKVSPNALAREVRLALWPEVYPELQRRVCVAATEMSWERSAARLAALYGQTLATAADASPDAARESA